MNVCIHSVVLQQLEVDDTTPMTLSQENKTQKSGKTENRLRKWV